jgi:predicted transcriptional regulator
MTSWLNRLSHQGQPARLGPLEYRVLEAMWERSEPGTVRDVLQLFPGLAYTSLLTTMVRLYQKGVLGRVMKGRAFVYSTRFSRPAFESARAQTAIRTALHQDLSRTELGELMSCFVASLSARDEALLNELDAIVKDRRQAGTRSA